MPHSLPPGVTRGSDGKFVSTGEAARFDAVEYQTFTTTIEVATGDYTSSGAAEDFGVTSNFEGVEVVDVDTLVDRHEIAHLLSVNTAISGYAHGSGISGVSAHRIGVELSASPSRAAIGFALGSDVIEDQESNQGDLTGIETALTVTDDADLVHRPIEVYMAATVEDDVDGTGMGGYVANDEAWGPGAGSWDFDRRDELYMNGVVEANGDSAAPFGATITGQMAFGIEET